MVLYLIDTKSEDRNGWEPYLVTGFGNGDVTFM